MAVNDKRFTRVPPESTGDRMYVVHAAEIQFTGAPGGYNWQIGERYTISGAGGPTMSVHLHGVQGSGTSGHLSVHYSKTDKYNEVQPIAGQSITDPDGLSVGSVVAAYDIYTPAQHIMGWDNPEYGVNVDRFGALYTRFADGPAELSAAGALKASSGQTIASYLFQNNILPQNFSNTLLNGGTVTHDSGIKAAVLTCPVTDQAKATHTSNFYHPYVAGSVNSFYVATRIGDTGKTNVVRSWGAFDATDGVFFQLNGTALRVVHRFTFNGSTTTHVMEQDDWNRDKLDGTGSSGATLDVTQNNTYWMDYQFMGNGYARWGVLIGGEKIICHEMTTLMNTNHNLLGNPHRPICWAQNNTGVAASTSEMYAYGASVTTDNQELNYTNKGDLKRFSTSGSILAGSTSTTYFFTMSPTLYLANGDLNHSYYAPQSISVAAFEDSATDADVKVEVRIFQRCQMRGVNFVKDIYSETEFDTAGDHLGHGPEMFRQIIDGTGEIKIADYLNDLPNTVHNSSEAATAIRTQPITEITKAAPAILTVGANPLTGQSRHLFDDLNQITVEGVTQADAAAALNGNQYYLSYTDSNSAALYSVLADLRDDRATRVLSVDNTTNVAEGDTITINGIYTATVLAFGATTITIGGRSSLLIDGVTAGTFTTTSGGSGTVASVSVSSTSSYPKDYETHLRAVDGSAWAANATDGSISGQPPSQPAWTFMARVLSAKAVDTNVNWTILFKENIQ